MAEFLTPEWIQDLDAAARAASLAVDSEEPLVIGQEVVGSPHGDVAYHLTVGRDGARVTEGSDPASIVTLVSDYPTALAVHRGELNTQHALSTGRTKVRGELLALVRHGDVLKEIEDVFAGVRSTTTYAR